MDEAKASRYRAAEAALWRADGAQPKERWVDVAGHGSRVRVLEVGDGPAILFVHGITTAGSVWATLASRLPGYRCLILDRPGCGLSQPLVPSRVGSFAALTDVQVAVLDALGVETADVVGSSMGGACVLSLAAGAPERVRRIVLEGAPAIAGIRLIRPHRMIATRLLAAMLVRRRMAARDVRWYFGQLGHQKLLARGWPQGAWLDWALSSANDTDTQRNDALVLQSVASWWGFHPKRLLDSVCLPGIRQPTLWLWGSHDPLATVDQGRAWASTMPDAAFMVLDAGHVPWLDDPELHARQIDAFLDGAAPRLRTERTGGDATSDTPWTALGASTEGGR